MEYLGSVSPVRVSRQPSSNINNGNNNNDQQLQQQESSTTASYNNNVDSQQQQQIDLLQSSSLEEIENETQLLKMFLYQLDTQRSNNGSHSGGGFHTTSTLGSGSGGGYVTGMGGMEGFSPRSMNSDGRHSSSQLNTARSGSTNLSSERRSIGTSTSPIPVNKTRSSILKDLWSQSIKNMLFMDNANTVTSPTTIPSRHRTPRNNPTYNNNNNMSSNTSINNNNNNNKSGTSYFDVLNHFAVDNSNNNANNEPPLIIESEHRVIETQTPIAQTPIATTTEYPFQNKTLNNNTTTNNTNTNTNNANIMNMTNTVTPISNNNNHMKTNSINKNNLNNNNELSLSAIAYELSPSDYATYRSNDTYRSNNDQQDLVQQPSSYQLQPIQENNNSHISSNSRNSIIANDITSRHTNTNDNTVNDYNNEDLNRIGLRKTRSGKVTYVNALSDDDDDNDEEVMDLEVNTDINSHSTPNRMNKHDDYDTDSQAATPQVTITTSRDYTNQRFNNNHSISVGNSSSPPTIDTTLSTYIPQQQQPEIPSSLPSIPKFSRLELHDSDVISNPNSPASTITVFTPQNQHGDASTRFQVPPRTTHVSLRKSTLVLDIDNNNEEDDDEDTIDNYDELSRSTAN